MIQRSRPRTGSRPGVRARRRRPAARPVRQGRMEQVMHALMQVPAHGARGRRCQQQFGHARREACRGRPRPRPAAVRPRRRRRCARRFAQQQVEVSSHQQPGQRPACCPVPAGLPEAAPACRPAIPAAARRTSGGPPHSLAPRPRENRDGFQQVFVLDTFDDDRLARGMAETGQLVDEVQGALSPGLVRARGGRAAVDLDRIEGRLRRRVRLLCPEPRSSSASRTPSAS